MNDAVLDHLSSVMKPVAQKAYRIYAYPFSEKAHHTPQWQRQDVLDDEREALIKAQELFKSQKFQRIEVRQSYYDQETQRLVDHMIKVFDFHPARHLKVILYLLIGAASCSIAAAVLAYFLA